MGRQVACWLCAWGSLGSLAARGCVQGACVATAFGMAERVATPGACHNVRPTSRPSARTPCSSGDRNDALHIVGKSSAGVTAQSLYGNDFSAIVTNVTGQSRDGWSRESTHAKTVRDSDYAAAPGCRLLLALPLSGWSASTRSSMHRNASGSSAPTCQQHSSQHSRPAPLCRRTSRRRRAATRTSSPSPTAWCGQGGDLRVSALPLVCVSEVAAVATCWPAQIEVYMAAACVLAATGGPGQSCSCTRPRQHCNSTFCSAPCASTYACSLQSLCLPAQQL